MWVPVLYTHQSQLPAHVQVRLQTCLNHQPSSETQGDLRFMYGKSGESLQSAVWI